jgi:hypothetical protein
MQITCRYNGSVPQRTGDETKRNEKNGKKKTWQGTPNRNQTMSIVEIEVRKIEARLPANIVQWTRDLPLAKRCREVMLAEIYLQAIAKHCGH